MNPFNLSVIVAFLLVPGCHFRQAINPNSPGSHLPVVTSAMHSDSLSRVTNAIERALAHLQIDSISIGTPFFASITNRHEKISLRFSSLKGAELLTDTLVVWEDTPIRRVQVTDFQTLPRLDKPTLKLLPVGDISLSLALGTALGLLKEKGYGQDFEEFALFVNTKYREKPQWHFVIRFAPYVVHTGLAVIVGKDGKANIVATNL